MSAMASFKVQDKVFAADTSIVERGSFEVRSVPRPYRVEWLEAQDTFAEVRAIMSANPGNLLLADKKVLGLHPGAPEGEKVLTGVAGEDFKTLEGATRVIDFLMSHGFTKGETLSVVGGGIMQDIGGFAAALYKRGVPWTLFPTTLLSMCDSCIGGKTGVNYSGAKNQLAIFSAPRRVVLNPYFLKTLDRRDLASGMGEILKLFIIGGGEFMELYARLVRNGFPGSFEDFRPLILNSLSIKRAVVEEDEFEVDHRRSLNYGHTVGHAVESLTDYAIPHGQAIAIGMITVNELACRRGLLERGACAGMRKLALELVDDNSLKAMRALQADRLLETMQKDKKAVGGSVFMVLPRTAGETVFIRERLDDKFRMEMSDIVRREFQS